MLGEAAKFSPRGEFLSVGGEFIFALGGLSVWKNVVFNLKINCSKDGFWHET
jgi:hypothetical protein